MALIITEILKVILSAVGIGFVALLPLIILGIVMGYKKEKKQQEHMRRMDAAAQRIIDSTKQR